MILKLGQGGMLEAGIGMCEDMVMVPGVGPLDL